ncbi:MAG: peptidylprolyl isomerase [Hyphomicrobiales bacterium]
MAFNTLVHAKDVLVLETSKGTVEIEFLPNVAPKHVAQVSKLAKSGFYNGIVFHRVIEGFMAQTGDPTGTGTGGSKEPNINAEFSITPFDRGVVGMARSQSHNSANSQFFIMFDEGHFLNGQYTAFGRVTKGMDAVDALQKGDGQGGIVPVDKRDKIIKASVVSR